MSALLAIGWFIWLYLAIMLVQYVTAALVVTRMLPEGRRWWMMPAFLAALALFAACVRYAPW